MSVNLFVVLMLLGGWFFGKLFSKMRLPSVLGMVVYGITLGVLFKDSIPPLIFEAEPFLKSLALIVILLRAGLGISKQTLKKVGKTAILMSFIPCIFEGVMLSFLFYYLFGFSLYVSGLTAFMISAVSPAVIVPSMLEFKAKGFGKKKEVPTLILAGASVDDVFAITLFSIFLGLATNSGVNVGQALLQIPLSILLGIIPGIGLGYLLVHYFKRKGKHIQTTEKALILLTSSMLLVQIGDILHSAALLGIMTVGFVLLENSNKVANELASKFSQIWIFAEITLFILIGLSVDIDVAFSTGFKGLFVITMGLIARSLGVLVATYRSNLNKKEKLFSVIAYLPKATVQAALGSVALRNGLADGETILALAVLSIIFTAPLGLILIRWQAPKLLNPNNAVELSE